METIKNKLVEYLHGMYGDLSIGKFLELIDLIEDEEELKELIEEKRRATKKQLQELPVFIRNTIFRISNIRKQGSPPRAEVFANIVFDELPGGDAYKSILNRSMVTPETKSMHFEVFFREPHAPHTEDEPNTNLLYELEQLPYNKEIGKASDLLGFLDFLDEMAEQVIKERGLYNFLVNNNSIVCPDFSVFDKMLKEKVLPDNKKIKWTGEKGEAHIFVYMFLDDSGDYKKTFRKCMYFPKGDIRAGNAPCGWGKVDKVNLKPYPFYKDLEKFK